VITPGGASKLENEIRSATGLTPGQEFVHKPHSQAPKFFPSNPDVSCNLCGVFAITIESTQRTPHSRRIALQ
jgi:hypothetical protein